MRSDAKEPVEFSVEDAILNTWVEDASPYLSLDTATRETVEAPPRDDTDPPDQGV